MDLFRSLIFVPGNRPDMLEGAGDFSADVLIPDLEDSVPDGEKERAREIVRERLGTLARRGQAVIPRINALDTGLTRDDLAAVVTPQIYGIAFGKVASPWDVMQVSDILEGIERDAGIPIGQTRLIPWLENSKAVVRAYEIASASPRILGVTFGAEDFTDDMGVKRTDEGSELAYPRAAVAVAARAAGVLAFDTPQTNFRDTQALERDIQIALTLGFKGKFAIHPGQLDTINTLFSPSQNEVEYARRVIKVFEEAEAKGSGATSLDGKLIDVPVVKRARALVQIANALAQKQW